MYVGCYGYNAQNDSDCVCAITMMKHTPERGGKTKNLTSWRRRRAASGSPSWYVVERDTKP